ncbi:YciI family protein [Glaciihabitans sp. INWT7]|uniref:YciI family protein n=1 Tax=Glaciihabitans sp. INWT7 TaxID=2596912 RepID=UPI001626AFB9|nr:YciI family protein [Glaciihabitans sp. INWT7]QNE45524.1 YciI family protein [Glaciihabitans sp. INWT7]
MRYSLLLNYSEAGGSEVPEEAMAEARAAFDRYAKSLDEAGVLLGADVMQPVAASTTVTLRSGSLQVQDGPFADTKEQLGGIVLIDVADLDAALAWAEKCPAAQWGTVEVRPTAVYFANGQWNPAA